MRYFYQDRLGADIGKAQKSLPFSQVVGGMTSVTSGEGDDRASMGLPGTQLAFVQAIRAAAVAAKKPFAVSP